MQVTVSQVTPQKTKHKAVVRFHDEEAHFQQNCKVLVFVDNDPTLTVPQFQALAIEAARKFLAQCLDQHSEPHTP